MSSHAIGPWVTSSLLLSQVISTGFTKPSLLLSIGIDVISKSYVATLNSALFCCMLVLFPACSPQTVKDVRSEGETSKVLAPAELAGTEWILEDLGGNGVLDDVQASLVFPKEFPSEGKISGNGSCNSFSGSATIVDGVISIGPLATTRMACVPAVNDQESRFLQALQSAERLEYNGPFLFLYAKGLDHPLRFIKK